MSIRNLAIFAVLSLLTSCRGDIFIAPAEVSDPVETLARCGSFYLLNEGNMGSNRASIDRFDSSTGEYTRNYYNLRNPNVVRELGDVGNSLTAYGGRLYAVINCSHKVEVTDLSSGVRIGKIDVPNCRYAVGVGDYLYVSSYVCPVQMGNDTPPGAIYKIDIQSLSVVSTIEVGYQPEMLVEAAGKLYVANSGGYRAPEYDDRISVIDISTFSVVNEFKVAPNLNRLCLSPDRKTLYVTSRGNYRDIPAKLYAVNTATGSASAVLDEPVSRMALRPDGHTAVAILSDRDDRLGLAQTSYAEIDLDNMSVTNRQPFDSESFPIIKMPYAIAIDPSTGQILLTDARNYVSSGRLHCFSPEGKLQWTRQTGDIPADILFF